MNQTRCGEKLGVQSDDTNHVDVVTARPEPTREGWSVQLTSDGMDSCSILSLSLPDKNLILALVFA